MKPITALKLVPWLKFKPSFYHLMANVFKIYIKMYEITALGYKALTYSLYYFTCSSLNLLWTVIEQLYFDSLLAAFYIYHAGKCYFC